MRGHAGRGQSDADTGAFRLWSGGQAEAGRDQAGAGFHVVDATAGAGAGAGAADPVIIDGDGDLALAQRQIHRNLGRLRMVDRVVDGFLRDPEQGNTHGGRQGIYRPVRPVRKGAACGMTAIADGKFKMVFNRMGKAEKMQNRWFCRFDDLAQRLHGPLKTLADRSKIGGNKAFGQPQPFQAARDTGQVGKGLIMQIHADPLPFLFQRLGQIERALAQPLFAGPRLGFDDGRLAGLIGGAQGEEIGRQQFGDMAGVADVIGAVAGRLMQRTRQRAGDFAMHDHRQMNPRPQLVIKDRPMCRHVVVKARIGAGVFGQDKIDLAHQQRPKRAVGDRRMGHGAPMGVDPGLIGGVESPVDTDDADIKVVMRHDLRDLGGHRPDRRAEIKLPCQKPRDAKILVQPGRGGDSDHVRTFQDRSQSDPVLRRSPWGFCPGSCANPHPHWGHPANALPQRPYTGGAQLLHPCATDHGGRRRWRDRNARPERPITRERKMKAKSMMLASAALICAAMPSLADTADKRIALSNNYAGNSWRQAMLTSWETVTAPAVAAGIVAAADAFTTAENQATEQAAQIQNMILEGYDAIVLNAASPTALNGAVKEACDAGIIVVSFDGIVTEPCAWRIAVDFAEMGRGQVEYLAKVLPEGGNLLEIRGLAGVFVDDEISAGIHAGVAQFPQFTIVGSVHGDWAQDVAQKAVAGILPSLPEIVGVVTQGGDGYGAAQAIAAAGRDMPTIIMGNRQDELAWWAEQKAANGYETMSVSIAPGVSTLAFWVAQQILDGKEVPQDLVVPFLSISQDTLEASLATTQAGGVANVEYSQEDAIAVIDGAM